MKVTRISGDGRSRKVMELCTLLESMKTRTAGLPVAFVREIWEVASWLAM